jgi:O-antigen/teichoic acid export membrane protein
VSLKFFFRGNSIFMSLSKGYTLLVSLISLKILTDYLPKDHYGIYSFAVAIAAVMIGVLESGMEHIIIREIAIRKDKAHYFGSAISAKIIILAVFLPIFCYIPVHFGFSEMERRAIYILIFSVSVRHFLFILPRAVFIAFEKLLYDFYYSLIVNTAKLTLFFIMIWFDLGFIAVISSILLSDIISGIFGFYIVHKKFLPFKPVFDLSAIAYFITQTAQYAISQWFIIAYFNIDIFVIRKFHPADVIAIYSVPYALVNSIIYFVVPLLSLFLPRLSILKDRNDDHAYNLFRDKIYFWFFTLILPICLSILVYAQELPKFIKGYEGSVFAFRILSFVIMFRSIDALVGYVLISHKKQSLINIGTGLSFFINLILDLILVPHFAVLGAACATLIADIISFVLMFHKFARKYLYTDLVNLLWKPIAAGCIFAIAAYLFRGSNIIYGFFLSLISYVFVLVVLNVNDIIRVDRI